jgi:hypothetical protein
MIQRIAIVLIGISLIYLNACTRNPLSSIGNTLAGTFKICNVENRSYVNGKAVVELCYVDRGTLTLKEDGGGVAVIDGKSSTFTWKSNQKKLTIINQAAPMVFDITHTEGQQLLRLISKSRSYEGVNYLDLSKLTLERI